MQLDQTSIVIRQRSMPELLDLSLRVFAMNFKPLILMTAIFAIPLALVNEWILSRVISDEFSELTWPAYVYLMILSVTIQAPLATVGATLFLGRMMFLQETATRELLNLLRGLWFRIFWTQAVWRGVLVAGWLTIASTNEDAMLPALTLFVLTMILIRMMRPFVQRNRSVGTKSFAFQRPRYNDHSKTKCSPTCS